MRFHQQTVFILILLALQGKSFSNAHRVKEIAVATTGKESAIMEEKEILPNAGKVETSTRVGGRKMIVETTTRASNEQGRNSTKVPMASSSAVIPSVGKRKGDEEENWKDNFMALSADYRSPKPHPPKNN